MTKPTRKRLTPRARLEIERYETEMAERREAERRAARAVPPPQHTTLGPIDPTQPPTAEVAAFVEGMADDGLISLGGTLEPPTETAIGDDDEAE